MDAPATETEALRAPLTQTAIITVTVIAHRAARWGARARAPAPAAAIAVPSEEQAPAVLATAAARWAVLPTPVPILC